MILALPPKDPVSTASGKSDPLTEGQIDTLHMATNLSFDAVSNNTGPPHPLSFPHMLLCLSGFSSTVNYFRLSLPVFFSVIILYSLKCYLCFFRDREVFLAHLDSLESL